MAKDKFISIKKDQKAHKKHIRNKILVNLITFIRSLGTIAIIPIFATYGTFATALAATGFFVTDFIDGQLARRLHGQSFFGSILDALSDKAFGIVCMLLLSTLNPIFLIIVGLELGILYVNYKSVERGNNSQSSIAGKAKTFLLAASVVGSYFAYSAPTLKTLLNYINISSLNTLLDLNPNLISTILAIPTIFGDLYVTYDYQKKANTQDQKREKELVTNISSNIKSNKEVTISDLHSKKRELLKQKAEIIEKKKELKSREELLHDLFDTEFYLEHKDGGLKKLLYK